PDLVCRSPGLNGSAVEGFERYARTPKLRLACALNASVQAERSDPRQAGEFVGVRLDGDVDASCLAADMHPVLVEAKCNVRALVFAVSHLGPYAVCHAE